MTFVQMALMLAVAAPIALMGPAAGAAQREAGETLPNGVELPSQWPPQIESLSHEPLPTPPYLISPPAVIPVDVGR